MLLRKVSILSLYSYLLYVDYILSTGVLVCIIISL